MSTTAQNKAKSLLNYITGSSGGWPTNTNVAIVAGLDYFIEESTDNIYFNEMNTACGMYGSYDSQSAFMDQVSDYANEKGCTTAYIYGQDDVRKKNPSTIQQPLISESFARHGIAVNFEYGDDTGRTYFSQRGNTDHLDKFHLWMQTPWFSDDNLLEIVSGSFNKNSFRTILGSSPVSSSLVPLFNPASFGSNNPYHPDYLVRNPGQHAAGPGGEFGLEFHKYNSGTDAYQNAADSGSFLIEKFIIGSGSIVNNEGYASQHKLEVIMTPDRNIIARDKDFFVNDSAPKYKADGDRWYGKNTIMLSTVSGSLIKMYDGSTKQVQDVAAGDIVKSYLPAGMPDEFSAQDWIDYSTTSLDGSTMSGSVVVRTFESEAFGYMLVNGSIKIPYSDQAMHKGIQYFTKIGDTWSWKKPDEGLSIGNYFLNSSEEEVEITSLVEVSESVKQYSLDVEDIDTYFQSDIVVHNLPPK